MDLTEIGTERMPSVLKDPFKKTCVKRVYVSFWLFSGKWSANGSVEFENGSTKGEQKFDGQTFDEVVQKIKSFISNID